MGSASERALAIFAIDENSEIAPFRQLQTEVIGAISNGRLLPGQRLPTVRALAAHLGIAPNTVASAYRSLEASGILEGRGRAGTFVAVGDDPLEVAARRISTEAARALVQLGLSREHARRLIDESLEIAMNEANH